MKINKISYNELIYNIKKNYFIPQKKIFYNDASPENFGELHFSEEKKEKKILFIMIHGGCWEFQYNYQYMNHISNFLSKNLNIYVWNTEYRRLGCGGGYPTTFIDIINSTAFINSYMLENYYIKFDKVVVIGHSIGGYLALWLSAISDKEEEIEEIKDKRITLPKLTHCIALGSVTDLILAYKSHICKEGLEKLWKTYPSINRTNYKYTSIVPLITKNSIPQTLIHGNLDNLVPIEHSIKYYEKINKINRDINFHVIDNMGHFDVIDINNRHWKVIENIIKNINNIWN
jgi:acetyl esterase/lipase